MTRRLKPCRTTDRLRSEGGKSLGVTLAAFLVALSLLNFGRSGEVRQQGHRTTTA